MRDQLNRAIKNTGKENYNLAVHLEFWLWRFGRTRMRHSSQKINGQERILITLEHASSQVQSNNVAFPP